MIFKAITEYKNLGLLIIRVGIGVMFILHGYPLLMGGPETWINLGGAMKFAGINFAPTFWGFMAAFSEFFGGICLLLGLFTVPACILLFITMVMASLFHFGVEKGPFMEVMMMKASHAMELGFLFLGLVFIGPGRYALDSRLVWK